MGALIGIGAVVGVGGVSAAGTPVGGLLSLTIADATAIDPASSIGASGSGWVAICVLKGLTSLVGTAVPSALTLTVSDPGFDATGAATTVTRTITGIAHMRRQHPNGASKMISTDGTDLTLYITLDDWIYSGTTITGAAIGSTFYTGCAASSAGSKTNNSTIGYPSPMFGWMNPQGLSTEGSSNYAVEGVAFHRHAMGGRQVACIKYTATDGTNNSATVTVAATALSTIQTIGNIAEVWPATMDLSGLTQGAICTVNAVVYPWLGTAFSLSADGAAWPTSLPHTPLRVLNDRTGGYGGAYAYVDGTGAGSPAVSATPATAKANPFASITTALAAIKVWNNANKGHNDVGGSFIRLLDNAGGDKTYTITGAPTNSPGIGYWTVEKDPDSAAVITIEGANVIQHPNLSRWRNLRFNSIAGSSYCIVGRDEARSMIIMDTCTIDNTASKNTITYYSHKYLLNLTLTGTNTIKVNNNPNATANRASMIGIVSSDAAAYIDTDSYAAKVMIGCHMPNYLIRRESAATADGDHGRIIYNNRVNDLSLIATSAVTVNHGMAIVQNLFEGTGGPVFNAFADGDLTTITNYIDTHNSGVGERCSRMYNDVAGSDVVPSGVQKLGVSKFSIYDNYNIKVDTFAAGGSSVGTWAYAYGVANKGNVSLFGTVSRSATDAPHNDNVETPYMGMAWHPGSEYNLYRTALGFTQAQIMAMFTSYTVAPQGVPAKGGNYRPLSSATHIKGRVPIGESVLKYDIASNLRATDGTGAAGCYEAAP